VALSLRKRSFAVSDVFMTSPRPPVFLFQRKCIQHKVLFITPPIFLIPPPSTRVLVGNFSLQVMMIDRLRPISCPQFPPLQLVIFLVSLPPPLAAFLWQKSRPPLPYLPLREFSFPSFFSPPVDSPPPILPKAPLFYFASFPLPSQSPNFVPFGLF